MKLSCLLLISTYSAITLSANSDRPSHSDARGTISATDVDLGPVDGQLAERAADLAPVDGQLVERACYNGDKVFGCDGGFCWSKCGTHGEWCWFADQDGTGPWITCRVDNDCSKIWLTKRPCAKGNCKACGCSC